MKKLMFKKITGCLLGAVLLGSLAACGQSEAQQTQPTGQSQTGQAASQSQTAEAAGQNQSSETAEPEAAPPADAVPKSEGNVMVAYFSATGNTKAVAEVIATATDGELYEIVPEEPYTSEDLDWTTSESRSNKEHEDPSIRPAIAGGAKDLGGYDTIFIGYPLWWGEAPNIVWNFVESSDLNGKTVIPFATSASSGFGTSGDTLKGFAPDAAWLDGQRFQSGAPDEEIQSWVSGLTIE